MSTPQIEDVAMTTEGAAMTISGEQLAEWEALANAVQNPDGAFLIPEKPWFAFIAAARTAVPALIAEVFRLRKAPENVGIMRDASGMLGARAEGAFLGEDVSPHQTNCTCAWCEDRRHVEGTTNGR